MRAPFKRLMALAVMIPLFCPAYLTAENPIPAPKAVKASTDFSLGPTTVEAGVLVELNAKEVPSVGTSKWVFVNPPTTGSWKLYENNSILVFSTPQPGSYVIILSYAQQNEKQEIAVNAIIHTLVVTGDIQPNPQPDPGPGPQPDPTPPVPTQTLSQVIAASIGKLANSPSRAMSTKLVTIYSNISTQVDNGKITSVDDIISLTNQQSRDQLGTNYTYWQPVIKDIGTYLQTKEEAMDGGLTLLQVSAYWKEIAAAFRSVGSN